MEADDWLDGAKREQYDSKGNEPSFVQTTIEVEAGDALIEL